MPRSTAITVSAVLVIICSAFTIVSGAVLALGSAFVSNSGATAKIPRNFGYILVVEALVVLGFGAWGLASGVGLLHTKQSARISLLIFAAILVFICLPAAVVIAVVPFPNTHDSNLGPNFLPMLRFGMSLFYAVFAALGGFWLYFFNKQGVKAEFRRQQLAVESLAPAWSLGTPIAVHSGSDGGRPISITIIGWFLLVGAACTPLGLLFVHGVFSGVQFPLFFLGFFFFGRSASIILVVWMAAQLVAAAGLLKLKNWGRLSTIGLQCLALANAALMAGIPANRLRFQQLMETMVATMRTSAWMILPSGVSNRRRAVASKVFFRKSMTR
jgi:hypothetical protein